MEGNSADERLKDEHANHSSQHGERRHSAVSRQSKQRGCCRMILWSEANSSLVAFRGENRFRIGARNSAYRNPTDATDQRSD
jgi:hypothetical protein